MLSFLSYHVSQGEVISYQGHHKKRELQRNTDLLPVIRKPTVLSVVSENEQSNLLFEDPVPMWKKKPSQLWLCVNKWKKLNSLAGNFCAISHHSPLLLVCWNLNVVAVAPIITVPKQQPKYEEVVEKEVN